MEVTFKGKKTNIINVPDFPRERPFDPGWLPTVWRKVSEIVHDLIAGSL